METPILCVLCFLQLVAHLKMLNRCIEKIGQKIRKKFPLFMKVSLITFCCNLTLGSSNLSLLFTIFSGQISSNSKWDDSRRRRWQFSQPVELYSRLNFPTFCEPFRHLGTGTLSNQMLLGLAPNSSDSVQCEETLIFWASVWQFPVGWNQFPPVLDGLGSNRVKIPGSGASNRKPKRVDKAGHFPIFLSVPENP